MAPDEIKHLDVYEAGPLTVVGFFGRQVLDNVDIPECRSEISGLIRDHNCTAIAFDLTGVVLVPSGLLGLLASIKQLGLDVYVFNPSEDILEVLEVTKLNQVLKVHTVDVEA